MIGGMTLQPSGPRPSTMTEFLYGPICETDAGAVAAWLEQLWHETAGHVEVYRSRRAALLESLYREARQHVHQSGDPS